MNTKISPLYSNVELRTVTWHLGHIHAHMC